MQNFCSFGSHCAGPVSISIISPYTPLGKLQGPCFGEPHAQTVEDLFPSSGVAAQTATLGYNFSFHWKRYSPTRDDTGVSKRRTSDNEGSQSKMWAVPCYAVRCLEHVHTSIKMCVCIGRDGVQMVLPVGSQKEKTCLQL